MVLLDGVTKTICVVGAGFCGMTAIIALKEEGLEPVCFELTDSPGGTWCYRQETLENVASVMKSTIINHSKEMGAYSNHPPPAECHTYMKHSDLYQYLMDHWKDKDCIRHVRFNTEVIRVRQAGDYDATGQWSVKVKHGITGEVSSHVFDGVMVCVGHMSRPKMPFYPGQELFEGKIMHSHSLKDVEAFTGQNVVVVGTGCSGLDAAVEASNVANNVYLSTRSGSHIINRVGYHGNPVDSIIFRRCFTFLLDFVPFEIISAMFEKIFTDRLFHRDLYAVPPIHHLLSKDPVVNDSIFIKLLSGSVMQKTDIDHFKHNAIVFKGENEAIDADVVIMATGYSWKFPFLDKDIPKKENDMIHLYKGVFPTNLKHPSLCFVGFFLTFGPGFPCAELQSRWAASVFSGKCQLPPEKTMIKHVHQRYNSNKKRYSPNDRMSLRADYVQYTDELASELGVKPNLIQLFFTDIRLFSYLVFGPHLPYQYRLSGPHKWEGARDAILTYEKRLVAPFQSKGYFCGTVMLILYMIFSLIFS